MKPNPKDYDTVDRKLLNKVRLKHFIAPDGTNRKYFERLCENVQKSLDDWYLPDTRETRTLSQRFSEDKELRQEELRLEELIESGIRFSDISKVKRITDRVILPEEAEQLFQKPISERTRDIKEVFTEIDAKTNPSIRFNVRFQGEQHPHGSIEAYISSMISKYLNQNAIAQKVSPTMAYMERGLIETLRELIGYAPGENIKCLGGNIVSGGTIANLTALVVARNKQKKLLEGMDFSRAAVFVSERAHYSLKGKIANVVGLKDGVTEVRTDNEGRIDVEDLRSKIKQVYSEGRVPLAVIATAGTTEEGAIDPLEEIADIAKIEIKKIIKVEDYEMYFHVDAAHGGALMVNPQLRRELFRGIERADSVTIDGHKMFYTNYPCGGIVFKNPTDPIEHIKQEAAYLFKEGEHFNPGTQTIEGSRGTDGILQLYSVLNALGREGLEAVHNHVMNMTRYLHDTIKDSDEFEPVHTPSMNILLSRYNPRNLRLDSRLKPHREEIINEINKRIPREVYNSGEFYIGETSFKDKQFGEKYLLRSVIMNPYVETETIDQHLEAVRSMAKRVSDQVITEFSIKLGEKNEQ